MKIFIIIIVVIFIGLAVYYGRYFFINKQVQEDLPEEVMKNIDQASTKTGAFIGADALHRGSGTAKIITDSSGKKILRLEEDFSVTNGPDLYVYLTKNENPSSEDDLGDLINLGRLKGNQGSQNYETNVDIDAYNTVVIWCQQFGVLFAHAVLK